MCKANVVDVVNDCVHVLEFLSQAVAPFSETRTQDFSYNAQEGLSLVISCVSHRLSAANVAIQNKQTEMEVY